MLDTGTASLTDLDGDTKIQVEESSDEDKIRFDTAGTERMIITDTGRVGIGNSSPSRPVHIEMAGDATLLDRTGSAGGVLLFANGGTVKGNVGVQSGGFGIGGGFRDPDLFMDTSGNVGLGTTSPASPLHIRVGTDNNLEIEETGGDLRLLAINDARSVNVPMEFAASRFEFLTGNVGIGTASASEKLTVDGNIANTSGDMTIDVAGDIILDADGENVKFRDGGVERGQIDLGSGNFTLRASTSDADMIFRVNDGGTEIVALTIDSSAAGAATFNDNVTAYSDERLKDNIETIENGLDKVEQLRGVTYTRDEKENIGVIAQEVEKILPEVVLTADDEMGTKSVDYGRLTAVLIEAVKDLSARVKELEGK